MFRQKRLMVKEYWESAVRQFCSWEDPDDLFARGSWSAGNRDGLLKLQPAVRRNARESNLGGNTSSLKLWEVFSTHHTNHRSLISPCSFIVGIQMRLTMWNDQLSGPDVWRSGVVQGTCLLGLCQTLRLGLGPLALLCQRFGSDSKVGSLLKVQWITTDFSGDHCGDQRQRHSPTGLIREYVVRACAVIVRDEMSLHYVWEPRWKRLG